MPTDYEYVEPDEVDELHACPSLAFPPVPSLTISNEDWQQAIELYRTYYSTVIERTGNGYHNEMLWGDFWRHCKKVCGWDAGLIEMTEGVSDVVRFANREARKGK